jgi:hypothetical protein
MDKLTVNPQPDRTPLFGLINVNTASAGALSSLPPFDEALAEAVVEVRVNLPPEQLESTAWLVTQGLLDPGTYQAVAPYLTPRGYQYRLRVIGFGYPCGQYCTLEAVIDFADGTPRIVYLRDLTRLGPPFALDPEAREL